jgi:hypothetical protein
MILYSTASLYLARIQVSNAVEQKRPEVIACRLVGNVK